VRVVGVLSASSVGQVARARPVHVVRGGRRLCRTCHSSHYHWSYRQGRRSVTTSVNKPLKSVTHGQCDARPTVNFPAAGHRSPLTGTKLYCLVTEARVCEQLAQRCYLKAQGWQSNARPSSRKSSAGPNRYTSRPGILFYTTLIDPRDGIVLQTELDDYCDKLVDERRSR